MKLDWFKQFDLSLRSRSESPHQTPERLVLEFCLIAVVTGITVVLWVAPTLNMAALMLYFLPVTLGGFFLGRYRAVVLTLLCVLSAICATLAAPLALSLGLKFLTLGVWACVLGMTALLIGTLSDERSRELAQLHECHQAETRCDELTGVANRRAFEQELNRRSAEWHHHEVDYSLLLVDVDHFKKFNDMYGHQAGDVVLRGVAQQLKQSVRDSDLVARYGGEELAVIMPSTSVVELKDAGERVRRAIEARRFEFEGLKLRLTVSVGAARIMDAETGHSLVERADVALYASKQTGRNCAHYHNGSTCQHFGAVTTLALSYDDSEEQSHPGDAYADGLTGLPSRKVFIEELRRRLAETRRYDAELSLMLVRLDDADVLRGDDEAAFCKAILIVGEAVQNMMRDSDLVAQFQANEFAVLMPSTDLKHALTPAERLRCKVAEFRTLRKNGAQLDVTVSIGLTAYQPNDDTASILDRAQESIRSALDRGGNFSVYHDGDGCLPAGFATSSPTISDPKSPTISDPKLTDQITGP